MSSVIWTILCRQGAKYVDINGPSVVVWCVCDKRISPFVVHTNTFCFCWCNMLDLFTFHDVRKIYSYWCIWSFLYELYCTKVHFRITSHVNICGIYLHINILYMCLIKLRFYITFICSTISTFIYVLLKQKYKFHKWLVWCILIELKCCVQCPTYLQAK